MTALVRLSQWILALFLVLSTISSAQARDLNRKDQTGLRQGYWVITGEMTGNRQYSPSAKVEEGYYKDDRREGVWKKYHPNGKLRSEINFIAGRPHGAYTTYYPNGQTEEKGNWEDNQNTGEFKRFYPNGKPQQHFFFTDSGKRNGTQYYFHENGNPSLIVDIANGKESGQYKRFASDGKLVEDRTFENGKVKVTHVQDHQKPQEQYAKPDEYNKSIGKEAVVVKDKPNSATVFQPNGYNTLYDENGSVAQSGEFRDGRLYNGKWYRYSSAGILVKIDLYRKGRYIGEGITEEN